VLDPLLDVLFPKRCAGCGTGPWPFCHVCLLQMVPLMPPWCRRCGLPAERSTARCRDCPPSEITATRSPFLFHGPVREAVHRLKYSGWRAVAEALGAAMQVVAPAEVADVVTWVPLSSRRLRERGFDQARRLANAVAPRLGLPVASLLVRVADTAPQARRGGQARRAVMAGAFRARARSPGRVMLVDDVLTTGATAGACARALLDAGAERVVLLTAARAASGPLRAGYTQPGSRPGLWLPGEEAPR